MFSITRLKLSSRAGTLQRIWRSKPIIFPIGKFHWTASSNSAIIPGREDHMTPQDLATAVRIARRNQGLRQDQLAAAANVGVRFIVDLEAGKPTVQMGKTLAVLNALG